MAQVVMCHGIGYQYKHRETSLTGWYEELRRSMHDAALPVPAPGQVDAVYYGNCYRSLAGKGVTADEDEFAGIPGLTSDDVTLPLESELLEAFAEGLGPAPAGGKGMVQAALRRLARSERLGRPAEEWVIWLVRQVRRYLDPGDGVRACAQQRFARVVTPGTRVVVAHSLGSVVAYEALCAHPDWNVDTFVTLGSPLGLGTIRDRLVLPDDVTWPPVRRWVNIAAEDDPVALVKKLAPLYGDRLEDRPVVNTPWYSPAKYTLGGHALPRYLTTAELAESVADALRAPER